MGHPKANTADGAKSVSHPRVFTGRKAASRVAEAAPCAQPPGYSVELTDGDGGLAEVLEATRAGEYKRDRQSRFDAGHDHHAGHHRAACRHFHADDHLAARRHLHVGGHRLHAAWHIWRLSLPPRGGGARACASGHPSVQHRGK